MVKLLFWPFGSRGDLKCREVREQSSELIDGGEGGSAVLVGRIQRHLAKCRACSAFVRTLQATVGVLRSMPAQGAPGQLKEKLRRISAGGQQPQ